MFAVEREIGEVNEEGNEVYQALSTPIKNIVMKCNPTIQDNLLLSVISKVSNPPSGFESQVLSAAIGYATLLGMQLQNSETDGLKAMEHIYLFTKNNTEEIKTIAETADPEDIKRLCRKTVQEMCDKLNGYVDKIDDRDVKNVQFVASQLALFDDVATFFGGEELFTSELTEEQERVAQDFVIMGIVDTGKNLL